MLSASGRGFVDGDGWDEGWADTPGLAFILYQLQDPAVKNQNMERHSKQSQREKYKCTFKNFEWTAAQPTSGFFRRWGRGTLDSAGKKNRKTDR